MPKVIKKILLGILKVVAATTILCFIGVFILTGGHFCRKSGTSSCIVVEEEGQFTGQRLKHSQAIMYTRLPTDEYRSKDLKIDTGDGPRKGKVRWAECTYGPDCDEEGMY